jgi:hypothetical protein
MAVVATEFWFIGNSYRTREIGRNKTRKFTVTGRAKSKTSRHHNQKGSVPIQLVCELKS